MKENSISTTRTMGLGYGICRTISIISRLRYGCHSIISCISIMMTCLLRIEALSEVKKGKLKITHRPLSIHHHLLLRSLFPIHSLARAHRPRSKFICCCFHRFRCIEHRRSRGLDPQVDGSFIQIRRQHLDRCFFSARLIVMYFLVFWS